MSREIYYDKYIIDYDDDDNPIYDTKLSHSELVRRAKAATGKQHVVSIDWYDTWDDYDTLDRNKRPKRRVQAKVIMA